MGGKKVDHPLNPVTSTTSDEEVSLAADTQSRPGAQIHPLVDLGLTALSEIPKVLLEVPKCLLHAFDPPAWNIGTPFA